MKYLPSTALFLISLFIAVVHSADLVTQDSRLSTGGPSGENCCGYVKPVLPPPKPCVRGPLMKVELPPCKFTPPCQCEDVESVPADFRK